MFSMTYKNSLIISINGNIWIMFFRYKHRNHRLNRKVITPYAHEYYVIDGLLFIPDKMKLDIEYAKRVGFLLHDKEHISKDYKKRFAKLYPKHKKEIGIETKSNTNKGKQKFTKEALENL